MQELIVKVVEVLKKGQSFYRKYTVWGGGQDRFPKLKGWAKVICPFSTTQKNCEYWAVLGKFWNCWKSTKIPFAECYELCNPHDPQFYKTILWNRIFDDLKIFAKMPYVRIFFCVVQNGQVTFAHPCIVTYFNQFPFVRQFFLGGCAGIYSQWRCPQQCQKEFVVKEDGGDIEEGSKFLQKRHCLGGQVLETILTNFNKLQFLRQFLKKSVFWIFISWDKFLLSGFLVTTKTRSNQDNQLLFLSAQFCTYHQYRTSYAHASCARINSSICSKISQTLFKILSDLKKNLSKTS